MRVSKQIGWSNEANLLYEILRAIERLQGITAGVFSNLAESSQTGITSNYYAPTFFRAGPTYQYLNITNVGTASITLDVGTTLAGTEIASGITIAPGQTLPVTMDMVFSVVTPLYITSSTPWTNVSLNIITISTS